MARLVTAGFELNEATNASSPDGAVQGGGGATISSGTFRSGAFALQCASGAGNLSGYFQFLATFAASRTYFFRAYLNFSQFPASTSIRVLDPTGFAWLYVQVTSSGTLQLIDGNGPTQIGSDSAALNTGTWYRLEMSTVINGSTQIASGDARLDGVSFASGNISTPQSPGSSAFVGWVGTPGANRTLFADDIALNDNQGADQNTWPGSGNVVLLRPTADSAVAAGWTDDAGSGTNIFDAVNNRPPNGIADTTSSTGLHQIRDATTGANEAYDATMTDYTTAGVPTGATVNVVDPIIATAAPVSTSAKVGQVGVVSNPAIAVINLTANSGQFWSGTAAGTYPTGWKWSHGTVTYAPSVTLGTAPVMRVTQVTSSTRIAMACFMGIYVDYTPAVSSFVAAPLESRLQAVPRASLW